MYSSRSLQKLLRRTVQLIPSTLQQSSRSSSAGVLQGQTKPLPVAEAAAKAAESPAPVAQVALKKKQRLPFAKELFLGRLENELLYFPEVLEPQQIEALKSRTFPIEKLFEKANLEKIGQQDGKIPEEILSELRSLGLYGQEIPKEFGGLGLNATECARLAEVTSVNSSLFMNIATHQAMGLKAILLYGNDAQKRKYLPKLATGENIAAFCLSESSSGSDIANMKCKATLSDDGKFYILNGSKAWICNGGIADVFTVFAQIEDPSLNEETITAFIVEKTFGGITHSELEEKLGVHAGNMVSVHFNNVPVPIENVLGSANDGLNIAANILSSGQFIMACSYAGSLKNIMSITSKHAINCTRFQKSLAEVELIKEIFAKMACKIYALESMAFFTAGLMDQKEQNDCTVEAAMIKVFGSQTALECVTDCLQILGLSGSSSNFQVEQYLQEIRLAALFPGTNEILQLFISLAGCQHAGKELADMVRKTRNPLLYPTHIIKKAWERRRQSSDNPKLTLDLSGFLHPSFLKPANLLEYSVLRLQFCVEKALSCYGKGIVEKQMVLNRLANVATDIYAIAASLSRASRSYCIGLPNSTHERLLAHAFCYDTVERIKGNVENILAGPYGANYINYNQIASEIFKNQGYFAEHPISRMWS